MSRKPRLRCLFEIVLPRCMFAAFIRYCSPSRAVKCVPARPVALPSACHAQLSQQTFQLSQTAWMQKRGGHGARSASGGTGEHAWTEPTRILAATATCGVIMQRNTSELSDDVSLQIAGMRVSVGSSTAAHAARAAHALQSVLQHMRHRQPQQEQQTQEQPGVKLSAATFPVQRTISISCGIAVVGYGDNLPAPATDRADEQHKQATGAESSTWHQRQGTDAAYKPWHSSAAVGRLVLLAVDASIRYGRVSTGAEPLQSVQIADAMLINLRMLQPRGPSMLPLAAQSAGKPIAPVTRRCDVSLACQPFRHTSILERHDMASSTAGMHACTQAQAAGQQNQVCESRAAWLRHHPLIAVHKVKGAHSSQLPWYARCIFICYDRNAKLHASSCCLPISCCHALFRLLHHVQWQMLSNGP